MTERTIEGLSRIPTVIGVVDCTGDVAQAQRLRLLSPLHWLFINGATTAEMRARPYASIGTPACASAVHAFAPEIARSFYGGLIEGDEDWVLELLREFFLPLTELSGTQAGYSVSLPKAAARLRGYRLGAVRAPLVEPPAKHLRALEAILDRGLDLVTHGVAVNQRCRRVQSRLLKAASNETPGGSKSKLRKNSSASGAPCRRSIPASSHSTEIGPV